MSTIQAPEGVEVFERCTVTPLHPQPEHPLVDAVLTLATVWAEDPTKRDSMIDALWPAHADSIRNIAADLEIADDYSRTEAVNQHHATEARIEAQLVASLIERGRL